MYNELIKEYYKSVRISMETFREMGVEFGYTKELVSGSAWKISGVQFAFYGLAVRSHDYATADYISNHGNKIQKRIRKMGVR